MTNPRRLSLRHLMFAGLVAASVGTVAPSARACGGGWWPEVQVDYRVQGIANAEKDMAAGDIYAAAGKVIRMMPYIKGYHKASTDPITNRSMRVLALATVRAHGDLTRISGEIPEELRAEFLGATAAERDRSLAWSARALGALSKANKSDATLASEYAEALAEVPSRRGKAHRLLEKLAAKDLLSSPEAYRALAVLRAQDGDEAGRSKALDRCQAMAKDASVCVAPSVAQNQERSAAVAAVAGES